MAETKDTTLCTLATLKAWLKVDDASADDDLVRIADAVTERIESYTKTIFVTRAASDVYNGDGSRRLLLRNRPIVAMTALTVKDTPTSTPLALVNGTDYDVDLRIGQIVSRARAFTRGFQNVAAGYTTGYGAKGSTALPQDVAQAALDYMKLVWQEQSANAIAATQVSVGNSTFILKPQMPWGIKQVLDTVWKRVAV